MRAERSDHPLQAGAITLDTRPTVQFGAGHVPGAVNIPLAGAFAPTAAALLGLDHDIVLIAEDEEALSESRMRLARVGLERVVGALEGGMANWAAQKMPIAQILQIPADELNRELTQDPASVQVIDVRRADEWRHAATSQRAAQASRSGGQDARGPGSNTPHRGALQRRGAQRDCLQLDPARRF